MKKLRFYDLFYIFLIASVFGWILEGVGSIVIDHLFLNHSALVLGPINAIYGFGAIFLPLILYKKQKASWGEIFLISFISCSILEYFMSWGMEFVIGFPAWNYSKFFLNINGRICLLYSMLWGFLGIVWIKYLYPFVQKLIAKMNPKVGKVLMYVLIVFLAFDIILTTVSVMRAHAYDKGISPQNAFEKFLDHTFNRDYLKNMYGNNWE